MKPSKYVEQGLVLSTLDTNSYWKNFNSVNYITLFHPMVT